MDKLKKIFKGIGFGGWLLFAATTICFFASIAGLRNQRQVSNIITEFSWVSRCWWESCTIPRPPRFLWESFDSFKILEKYGTFIDVAVGTGPNNNIVVSYCVSDQPGNLYNEICKISIRQLSHPNDDWNELSLPANIYYVKYVAIGSEPNSTLIVVSSDHDVFWSTSPYNDWKKQSLPDNFNNISAIAIGSGPNSAIVVVSNNDDVFWSTSPYNDWKKTTLLPDHSSAVIAVAIESEPTSTILVAFQDRVLMWKPQYENWRDMFQPIDDNSPIKAVALGPEPDSNIFVGYPKGKVILRTTPDAEWENIFLPEDYNDSVSDLVGLSPTSTIVTLKKMQNRFDLQAWLPQTPPLWIWLLMIVGVFDFLFFARRVQHVRQQIGKEPESGEQNVPNLENDSPIDSHKQATKAMLKVAKRIFLFVSNPEASAPLIVALTGKWGSGKSSLMRLVERDLRENHYPCVWFNAWHHQNETHLFAALMESIRCNAVPRFFRKFRRNLEFRLNLFKLRLSDDPIPVILTTLVIIVILFIFVKLGMDSFSDIDLDLFWNLKLLIEVVSNPTSWVLPIPPFLLLLVWMSRWNFLKAFGVTPASLTLASVAWIQFPSFRDRLSFRHKFGLAFKDVCEAFGDRRLVIIIDDLDRCQTEHVVEFLEAVNFLTSSGKCFVLLGIDENQVKRAVGLHYKDIAAETAREKQKCKDNPENKRDDAEENKKTVGDISEIESYEARQSYAEHYLEKLINLNIKVPVVDEQDLSTLRSKDQS